MGKGYVGKCICYLLLLAVSGLAQAGTHHYYYTDPQGTVLAKADASGNIIASYDYAPYGTAVASMSPAPNGPGYTGHVNDPDTGLVYMQARYYDPSTGRFLSVDAAPPKPGDLNYMNRYEYVGNNPIMRTDPTGNYICSGTKDQCNVISQALTDVKTAASKLASGSAGQQALNKVLAFYGKAEQKNGVNVGFGNAHDNNAETKTVGKETNITFNLANIRDTGSNQGTTARAETASAFAHEGQHGIDGQFFGAPINKAEWRVTEKNAFMTQSYVDEGLNKTSPYELWQSGWKESPITNGLRESAADFNADYTVFGNAGSKGQ
ncbi:MAG TPA: RHS repeat-associated core domain-containing protein [Rhodanobacter sp.]|jgi:RHS repeat-associated protein|nr:RHS repeat-associated core domain-containing protein [Rhodanobacter sp.]